MEKTPPAQLPALPSDLAAHPQTAADLPRIAELLSAVHPDHPVSLADLQRLEEMRLPGEVFTRTLLERGGELVALWEVGVPRMDGHPGWLSVAIATRQEALAGALLAHAEACALGQGAGVLVSRVREGSWEKPFLEAHGYAEHDRMWLSVLDLRTLDFARFAGAEAAAREAGVEFRPLSSFGDWTPELQRRLYDLMAALLADVPSTTPVSVWPFEVWQARYASKLQHPEGVWLPAASGWASASCTCPSARGPARCTTA